MTRSIATPKKKKQYVPRTKYKKNGSLVRKKEKRKEMLYDINSPILQSIWTISSETMTGGNRNMILQKDFENIMDEGRSFKKD